jgi:hypothetical protein
MKTKMILMGLGLCSLLAIPSTNALAEDGYCSNVQVLQAGNSTYAGKVLKLRNTDKVCGSWAVGTDLYFLLPEPQANGMLAAALSAQAAGGKIVIVPAEGNSGFTSLGSLAAVYTDIP